MRVFQNFSLYSSYKPQLKKLIESVKSFDDKMGVFLNDGYGACQILLPAYTKDKSFFFALGDEAEFQYAWAKEKGMNMSKIKSLDEILLLQIEDFKTEIFYNVSPIIFPSTFVRKLPGCVKKTIAWRAVPDNTDFSAYDLIVANFKDILDGFTLKGYNTALFYPAHAPVMSKYSDNNDRPIDILFIGSYTRRHLNRAKILESVASLSGKYKVVFSLENSRFNRVAESPIGKFLPLKKYRRPKSVVEICEDPVFGQDFYKKLSSSKITINVGIDLKKNIKGNMRCWEALSNRTLMLADEGIYPPFFKEDFNFISYKNETDILLKIEEILENYEQYKTIADTGYDMIRTHYSKEKQWEDFLKLCK